MTEIEEVTPCMDRSLGSEAFVNHIEDVSKVSVNNQEKVGVEVLSVVLMFRIDFIGTKKKKEKDDMDVKNSL
eukprot:CAMPEP_0178975284 /NCGR_PEP_ID=MMETSP0789-20121207/23045_1 /TAXON_ID=3005 /ORGANISM="Rhizosolenia setigera, Strain CCMP 1694" /LENGTH=71 /DNA_ID=CAMNT_0020663949 /DNA_START=59 /DNA_END=275 /DNA_ORIENTATION=+